MIEKFKVVEPFKHGERQYAKGDEMAAPADVTPAEVEAWHAAGWISDLSADGRLEDEPIVRGRQVIEPAGARTGSNVEGAK